MSIIPLSAIELYAMRAALAGDHSKWHDLPFNGMIRYTCENLERAGASGLQAAQRAISYLFDSETVIALNQIDLDSPPPAAPTVKRPSDDIAVPALPANVALTTDQERLATEAGNWEREYTAWAGRQANETPLNFHQLGGLILGGVAIGRRLYVGTDWGEDVHPNLYGMIVAISTYYHKTTSLRLAQGMLRRTMPHMQLPDPGSPENFMRQLAGDCSLLDGLRPADKMRYMRGMPFAGQRVIFRDELSGLFRSMSKDYMAGMKESIMKMFDGDEEIPLSSNTRGTTVVHDIALSIFGTTTPAGLSCAVTNVDWRDGNMARFCLIAPPPDYHDRPRHKRESSDRLDAILRTLHERLPMPPALDSMGELPKMERWSLIVKPYEQFSAYSETIRAMTAPGENLDDRLRPLYGRHPVKALKVAIILAALDWAENGCKERPIVQEPHWYRAQQIAEEWRASAHRVLKDMTTSEYNEAETKVRLALARDDSNGMTKTALLKITDLRVRDLDEVLGTLIDAGEIEEVDQKSTGGRRARVYRWTIDTGASGKK